VSKYPRKTAEDVKAAIEATRESLDRGRALLAHAEGASLSKAIQKLADALRKPLARLDRDLEKLRAKLAEKDKGRAARPADAMEALPPTPARSGSEQLVSTPVRSVPRLVGARRKRPARGTKGSSES